MPNAPKISSGKPSIALVSQSRRSFLISAAAGCGAVGLWYLHYTMPVAAAANSKASRSGPVTIVQFSADGKNMGKVSLTRVMKPDEEWQRELSPISYEVARRSGTERPYSGSTWNLHERGIYRCVCCDVALFNSETKFESGTGWPSFWQPIARENVSDSTDDSIGMQRTAVSCLLCDAHLGHVFDDGPEPTGLRYCMNSAAMRFAKIA